LFSLNEIHCKRISTAYDSSTPKKKKKTNKLSFITPFYPSSLQEGALREAFIVLWEPLKEFDDCLNLYMIIKVMQVVTMTSHLKPMEHDAMK
jgi:hypothetical protein